MGNANHRPPQWQEQRARTADALCRAIGQICDGWDAAVDAHRSRGYPSQSPGPRAAAGTVRVDPNDPLHARQQPPATSKVSAFGDQTGNQALREDRAERWLASARGHLLQLLRFSGAEVPGERRWTGRFYPPSLRATLTRAAEDLVEMWPNNAGHFISQVIRLGGIAVTEWPPKPKVGETIETPEGPVTVAAPPKAVETCTECRTTITGTAADPVRRIDGKPYHMAPCWETARKRLRRKGTAA